MNDTSWFGTFLMCVCIALGACILLCLIRAIRGPRFTDRIVAVNLIGSITIIIMTLLSVYFGEGFLVDISVVYALLSFIAVVVLARVVIIRRLGQKEREEQEGTNAKGAQK